MHQSLSVNPVWAEYCLAKQEVCSQGDRTDFVGLLGDSRNQCYRPIQRETTLLEADSHMLCN